MVRTGNWEPAHEDSSDTVTKTYKSFQNWTSCPSWSWGSATESSKLTCAWLEISHLCQVCSTRIVREDVIFILQKTIILLFPFSFELARHFFRIQCIKGTFSRNRFWDYHFRSKLRYANTSLILKQPVASIQLFKRGDSQCNMGSADLPEFAVRGIEF
jgi:hypothetical protein